METVLPNSFSKKKKLAGYFLENNFDALENNIKFRQVCVWVQASFFVTKLFQMSQDFENLMAHFTNGQCCC